MRCRLPIITTLILLMSLCGIASGQKGQTMPIPNTLPSAQKPGAEFNVAVPEMPPQYSKPMSAALRAYVDEPPYRNPSDCMPISYWFDVPYYYWPIPDDYGDDFFNMRFTPMENRDCRLATVALCFFADGSTIVSGDGIRILVWDDDGFGFPGNELAHIDVPAESVIWYPWYTVVDFTPFDLHFTNQDFHVGYTTLNQAEDVYAVLSDEGTHGTLRSSEFYMGMWGTMYNDWGLDVNFIIEADVCCTGGSGPSPCPRYQYGTFIAYYYWTIPDSYGDDFFNERFTNVNVAPGTLTTAFLNMYPDGSVDVTGEGIDVIVWDDDGSGYPGTELGRVNVPTADMVRFPIELEVDLRPLNVIVSAYEDFHIGYTTVNQAAGNVMAILSDDGSGPAEYRSSELYLGLWGLMIDDWGVDVDFLIAAELCMGDTPPPPLCDWLKYNGDAYYYWTIPDAYGDDYFNMRFTHTDACTIKTLEIAFYEYGSVGSPGADFILFNSDGTYPTDTIAVYSVNPVTSWFPAFESADCSADNIVIEGDYHLGYTPIYNDPADVLACLSDNGSMPTGRAGYWAGLWQLSVVHWGIDVNFLMQVYKCCPVEVPPGCSEGDDDWPTYAHDYARTGYTNIEVGDLCGFKRIWDYVTDTRCYFSTPTIAGDIVYSAFDNKMVALDIATGSEVWNTDTHPDYMLPTQIRSSPTVEDGVIYFSTGAYEGMIAADALTGDIIWRRGYGGDLLEGTPGRMRFCPTVIIGDYLYFGGDGGTIYQLDKNTGVTIHFVPTPYGNSVWVSPSSDGTNLYFACSYTTYGGDAGSGATEGALYKYDGDLNLIGVFSGLQGWNEGCTSGATYSQAEDALFAAFSLYDHTGFDAYIQKIDAASMTALWPSYWLMGRPYYSTIALMPGLERLYYGNYAAKDDRFSGLWCRTYDNVTAWQDFTIGDVMMPAAVSCDPYVFWTTILPGAGFHCSDALTGELLLSYELSSYGLGTAIAKRGGVAYVASTQLESICGQGGGRLSMYSTGGPDRPRLFVPEHYVEIDPPLDFTDPDGTERTAEIFCNEGCAGLRYCLRLEADPDYPTRLFGSDVNPKLAARAKDHADRIIEYSIDDPNAMDGWKAAKRGKRHFDGEIDEDRMSKKSMDVQTATAPPNWVTMLSPDEGMVRVVDCYEATFAFQTSAMNRGDNLFYVWIATDDPDYTECETMFNDCSTPPYQVHDIVQVNAMLGFAFCGDYLDFGDGGDDYEYVNNAGWLDNRYVPDAFTVDGTEDPLFEGSFFWMVDYDRVAWVEGGQGAEFNHLMPDSICIHIESMYMDMLFHPDGSSEQIFGDYFESAVIDSLINRHTGELSNELTIGMRMTFRELGAYGSMFNNFKVIAYDLSNRSSTSPVLDMYWGLFADWDMPGDPAGYEQVNGAIDSSFVYQFNEVSGEIAGFGSLPMKGSSLDGATTTEALYNGYGIAYDPYGWIPLADMIFEIVDGYCPQGNWCYNWNAAPGAAPDDRAMIMTAGKTHFMPLDSVSGAYVVWYFPTGANLGEVYDLICFANKWAGYGRGDVNNDNEINLNDLVYLCKYLCGGNPPYPFMYLGDVDADGDVDFDDAEYFYDFFFNGGPMLLSKLIR